MKSRFIFLMFIIMNSHLYSQTTLKRYKSLKKSETNNNLVEMNVVSSKITSPAETPAYKSIFDLEGRGQQSILSGKSITEINDLLNKKYLLPESKKESLVDLTTRNIRLTFSIERLADYLSGNDQFNAYDRVEDLKYCFDIDDNVHAEVKFEKWNKYTTEYGTLDIGSLEFNRSFTANLDASNGIENTNTFKNTKSTEDTAKGKKSSDEETDNSKFTSGITGKLGYSNSSKESQLIKYRYLQLTGFFDERTFKIHQQGTREIDLAGNVSIDIAIKLPVDEVLFTSFTGLNDDSNLPRAASQVKMISTLYRIPDSNLLPKGVFGELDFDFIVRHIIRKAKTYAEHDDVIKFIGGSNKKTITLIKPQDLKTPIYFLSLKYSDGISKSLSFDNNSKPIVIQFMSYREAVQFREWLINSIPNNFTGNLIISGKTILFEDKSIADNFIRTNLEKVSVEVLK